MRVCRGPCQQVVAERHGVVVLGVAGAVQQDDVAGGHGVGELPPGKWAFVELGEVPSPELLPAVWIVAEPPAELMAGTRVRDPVGELQ